TARALPLRATCRARRAANRRRRVVGMERFQFAERLDQRLELVDTDAPLDFPLRVRPVRLGGLECRHAFAGDRNLAYARILAPDDLDESALDQRIEVARQGRP